MWTGRERAWTTQVFSGNDWTIHQHLSQYCLFILNLLQYITYLAWAQESCNTVLIRLVYIVRGPHTLGWPCPTQNSCQSGVSDGSGSSGCPTLLRQSPPTQNLTERPPKYSPTPPAFKTSCPRQLWVGRLPLSPYTPILSHSTTQVLQKNPVLKPNL